MDGVATPIIGRPRPLPGHDTPNPAYHPHTLNYEEPVCLNALARHFQAQVIQAREHAQVRAIKLVLAMSKSFRWTV